MANLITAIQLLESLGLTDMLIPFVLIFAVVFAIVANVKLFKRNINIIVALVTSLLTVIPHITGTYPKCLDIILIINSAVPKVGMLLIGILMFLLVVGLLGINLDFFTKALPFIAIAIAGITAYNFLTSNTLGCGTILTIPASLMDLLPYLLALLLLLALILFATGGKESKGKAGPKKPEKGPYGPES
jgi:hypothetical protein